MPHKIQKISRKRQVVIANQINESRFRMSKGEQKLMLYCIAMIDNKEGRIQRTFEMDIKDFISFLGIKGNDYYQRMLDMTRDFASRIFEIKQPNGELHRIPVLSIIKYKKGSIELKVNDQLAPYLLDLKSKFTKYSLQEVLSLKSGFSMRLYQLLAQYQYRQEVEFSLEKLRFCLNVDDGKLQRFFDFKKRVLEPAKNEINEKSSLRFEYKLIKKGRKVIAIKFIITQPIQPQLNFLNLEPKLSIPEALKNALQDTLNLSDDKIHQLALKNAPEALKNALDVVLVYTRDKLTKKIQKPVNLFYDVLRNPDKYDLSQHVEDLRREEKEAEEQRLAEEQRQKEEEEKKKKEAEQREIKYQAIDHYIDLNPEEYQDILNKVLEELKTQKGKRFLYMQVEKLSTKEKISMTEALEKSPLTKILGRQKLWEEKLKEYVSFFH